MNVGITKRERMNTGDRLGKTRERILRSLKLWHLRHLPRYQLKKYRKTLEKEGRKLK